MIRNLFEAVSLLKAAPEKIKDFKGLLDYARNIYKEATGVFPEGIDFLTLKNAAREVANIRDPKKVVQFPGGGKDKVSPFKERPGEFGMTILDDAGNPVKTTTGETPESLMKKLVEMTNQNLKDRGLGNIKLGDKIPPPKNKKPAVDPELKKSEDLKKEFKDFEDRNKTRPGKIDYDKMSTFLGVKLRGDETFEELLEIERKNKIKKFKQDNDRALEDLVDDAGGTKEDVEFDDEPFDAAGGGLVNLIAKMQAKFGKKAITTADKIARPESALNREMFGEFNERMNRKILDVEKTPPGFKLSRERLLKNFPEIDESMADEIMTLDRDLQLRVIAMLKDRRKNPEAYDKLLMEMGDTLDFQGEFDRSVRRSKNAGGGLSYLMGM